MDKEITLTEFNKLSLEERAQVVLRIQPWAYLEKEGYVVLVGGTPKSGASYKITNKGLGFMDKAI